MASLTFPPIEDSSPEASELANFRLHPAKVGEIPVWIPDEEETWFRKHYPMVERAEDDDGINRLSGDRDEVESYAETLCSDYGWRQVDAYGDSVPGSEERFWVVELERES